MRRAFVCIILFVLVSAFTLAARPGSGQTEDRAPFSAQPLESADKAMGDVLGSIPAGTTTGSIVLLGVEFVGNNYWVTAAGFASTDEQNYLLELDLNGNIVNQFVQPTTSVWGWRDLAWDGTYLYAGDEGNVIQQINPATGVPTGVTIPSPSGVPRALAYDLATDHFWVANFRSPIYEIDRTGAVIHTYANSLAIYGLGWDTGSPGGPYLWAWSQDGPTGSLATQIDPATGLSTGEVFNGADLPGNNIAGGATVTTAHPAHPGWPTLVTMHQASPDTIVLYDLYSPVEFSMGCATWTDECPTGGATSGDGYANPGEVIHYTFPVTNNGIMNSSEVTVTVTSPSPWVVMVEDEAIIPWLAMGETREATGIQVGIRSDTPCGTLIPLTVDVRSAEGQNVFDIQLNVNSGSIVLTQNFESWPPAGWTIVGNLSNGFVWNSNIFFGYPNFTAGSGLSATAASDIAYPMDTELRTPIFSLSGLTNPVLSFEVTYWDWPGHDDLFAVDISMDGGAAWQSLLLWMEESHNAESVILDLSAYAGQTNCMVRFRYATLTWDWFAQVDDVLIGECTFCDNCFLDVQSVWASWAPAAGEPVRFGAHVNTDCSPVVYDWEIYDELMFMIDESDQAEPVFVFPAEGLYFVHLTVAAGVDVQDVWFFFFVDAGYNYYFYDDAGQLEGAVNTHTGRFRIILPDRPMSSGWFIDYGWFDDRAVTPEGWTILSLHSSGGVPWIAHIGIVLDHDIVHGFFLYKDRGIYIDFADRPGQ